MIKKTMLTRFRVGFSLVAIPFGVLFFAFSLTNSLHAEDTPARRAIRAGKVITCAGEPIIDGVILIADGKIEAIGPFGTIAALVTISLINKSQSSAVHQASRKHIP